MSDELDKLTQFVLLDDLRISNEKVEAELIGLRKALGTKATRTVLWENREVTEAEASVMPLDEEGEGKLVEFSIRSPSSDFSVWIERDGETVWDELYSRLASLSTDISNIAAFQRNDRYIVTITDILFKKSIKGVIRVGTDITFDLIYASCEVA